jgi:hypothetical protein
MNANEIANSLEEWVSPRTVEQAIIMLRQQQAEIEALKMGFANNGTSDSELAEVRALANRWFLDAARYQWLRAEFAAGRETYLAEDIPNGEELDKYIDRKANK